MQFAELLNQEILVLIPRVHPKLHHYVRLVGVESGGIWIESQDFTNTMLQTIGTATAPNSPVFFLPYSEIAVAIATVAGPSLNERAFGV
jgi:hypothetical protein